ncbi:hypothetical protein CI102_4131, partial [Trichoderma harzianum]
LEDDEKNIYRPGGTAGGALESAAMAGDQELIKMLIANGANVNRVGAWNGTALNVSVRHVDIELISYLLDLGADPAIYAGYNTSTLHQLAGGWVPDSAKASAILQLVLERCGAGANLNPYPYGTPLQQACFAGQRDKIHILLSAGADIHAESGQFGDAIQTASMHGNGEINVNALLGGSELRADPNHASGGIFNTALQAASYNGHEKIVNTLLHHGSEINQGGGLYGCALLAAAAAGHEDICRLLIESGAD